ncbi:magnesium transporter [Rickettsiales bacterium]|nr:magnesium transporter [Rickettsiales bacterium]
MSDISLNEIDKLDKKEKITFFIQNGKNSQAKSIFEDLHPVDQAEIISNIDFELRIRVIAAICNVKLQFLVYLEDHIKEEVIDLLGSKYVSRGIEDLDLDDIVKIIEILEQDKIDEIIGNFPKDLLHNVQKTLSYPEDSIGRVMNQNFIAINQDWTIGQATQFLQEKEDLSDDFYNIILIDHNNIPVAEISVSTIIKHKKNIILKNLISSNKLHSINDKSNQEDAARYFTKYSLQYLVITNDEGKLVGLIYANDVIDIVEEEDEEDILLLAGVNDINLHSTNFITAKSRIPWLVISLVFSSFSAIIIALFAKEIEKMVVIAVLLPIVASVSGAAGNQTLAIMVRSIATLDIENIGYWKVIIKESVVGSINGLFLALIASAACYVWQDNYILSISIFISIFVTILISCLFGAAIPTILNKLKFDPAISSGVFLTTLIDATSFFVFLGFISIIS